MSTLRLRMVSVGLLFMGVGILSFIMLFLLGIAGAIIPVLDWFEFLAYVILGIAALMVLGFVLCFASPKDAGRKKWLFLAATGFALGIATRGISLRIPIPGDDAFRLVIASIVNCITSACVLEIVGLGFFLLWLRSLALHFDASKQSKLASDMLKTGAVIFLGYAAVTGWSVIQFGNKAGVQKFDELGMFASVVLAGAVLGALIWSAGLASLLLGVRRILPTKSEPVLSPLS